MLLMMLMIMMMMLMVVVMVMMMTLMVAMMLVLLVMAVLLTMLTMTLSPMMTLMPHNHRMWAVIGIYTGREDNIFWRRIDGDPHGRIEAAGAHALSVGDCVPLGRDIVHSVTNPIPRLTAALHVYGGDFFADGRSEWDAETLREKPYDVEKNLRLFEDSNARLPAG